MTKTKLSSSVDMLHCHIDKMKQVNGERAIRQRKRQERQRLNKSKFKTRTKRIHFNMPIIHETPQIQRGYNIAEKWRNEE